MRGKFEKFKKSIESHYDEGENKVYQILNCLEQMHNIRLVERIARPISYEQKETYFQSFKQKFLQLHFLLQNLQKEIPKQSESGNERHKGGTSTLGVKQKIKKQDIRKIQSSYKQIHSITTLSSAYERRVHEVQSRISSFLQHKQPLLSQISSLNSDIQCLKRLKEQSLFENDLYKTKMLKQLQNKFETIRSEINLIKERFEIKLSEINDIGHCIENLTDYVEIIASNSNILHHLKQVTDRVNIMLQQNEQFQDLPKQLSDLRFDLKQITICEEVFKQKVKIMKEIMVKLEKQKAAIEQPVIDYQQLLGSLSHNIEEYITHNVCHFCGIVFSFQNVNTKCTKNSSALDINQFIGFCLQKPESIKWSTQRHYFAQPAHKYTYFNTQENNTFSLNLKALLLKLKTICLIKSIKLEKNFKNADKAASGACNRIQMQYILMQVCELNQHQCEIFLSICQKPSPQTYRYSSILLKLQNIVIGNSIPSSVPKQENTIIPQQTNNLELQKAKDPTIDF